MTASTLALTPAIGFGTCDRCGMTCTEVVYDNRAMRMNPEQRYLCTARCYKAPVPAPLFDLDLIDYVTATVTTESGSQYVVVARSWGVVVTGTRGTYPGTVTKGTCLRVVDGCLWVCDDFSRRPLLRTTRLVSVDVHEN